MPFKDDIVKNNLLNGYTLKAYPLLGFGKYNKAEENIEKAKKSLNMISEFMPMIK